MAQVHIAPAFGPEQIPVNHNPIFQGRLEAFRDLGSALIARGDLDAEELTRLAATMAHTHIEGDTLLDRVDGLVSVWLMDGDTATWSTPEIGAWIYLVGINADRYQALGKGSVENRRTLGWLRARFQMLQSHPAFINAPQPLHLLYARAADLLGGVLHNGRIWGRGEAWAVREGV